MTLETPLVASVTCPTGSFDHLVAFWTIEETVMIVVVKIWIHETTDTAGPAIAPCLRALIVTDITVITMNLSLVIIYRVKPLESCIPHKHEGVNN